MEMTVSKITIKPSLNNLLIPQDKKNLHPLHKNLILAAVFDILQAALRPSTILKYLLNKMEQLRHSK